MKKTMKNPADGSGLLSQSIEVFQLTEYLWLAHHHGIETGGDSKQVPHRFGPSIVINMSL